MNDFRIPVTIITGFLGAGKTTLLNQIIKKYSSKKFAIIENEFGEIGIDGSLIVGVNENIFELSNGCICCSLNSDFYRTIDLLMQSEHVFNHLIIETTGIADPLSIINAFFDGGGIQEQFKVDSVIAVVDAVNIEDLLYEYPEIRKQLSVSDQILINKIDGVNPDYTEELTKLVQSINPLSTLYKISFGDISDFEVLNTDSYSASQVEKSTNSFNISSFQTTYPKHDIFTVGFEYNRILDFSKFKLWMDNYMFFNSNKILRIKGILAFEDLPERFVFHSVLNSFLLEPSKPWDDEEKYTKLIFIGKYIDEDELKNGIESLFV